MRIGRTKLGFEILDDGGIDIWRYRNPEENTKDYRTVHSPYFGSVSLVFDTGSYYLSYPFCDRTNIILISCPNTRKTYTLPVYRSALFKVGLSLESQPLEGV